MTAKRIVVVITLLLIGSLVYLASNCDNGADVEPLVGTWVNPDYNGVEEGERPGKIIITANNDGTLTGASYVNDFDTVLDFETIMTITEKWADSQGKTWYKVEGEYQGSTIYSLFFVSADDTYFEGNGSTEGYPIEVSPEGGMYGIYYRPGYVPDNIPEDDDNIELLISIWINTDYNGADTSAKIVITEYDTDDVLLTGYENDYDAIPTDSFVVTITDNWWEADDTNYFTGLMTIESVLFYLLIKISPDGNTMEIDVSLDGYPLFIDPGSDNYYVYYSQ